MMNRHRMYRESRARYFPILLPLATVGRVRGVSPFFSSITTTNVVRLHHTSKHFRRIFSRKKSGRSIPDFVSMSYTPSVKLLHKENALNSLKFRSIAYFLIIQPHYAPLALREGPGVSPFIHYLPPPASRLCFHFSFNAFSFL